MLKSWWFTLALGLAAGFFFGYMFGESQPVKPTSAPLMSQPAEGQLPEGHPPIGAGMPSGMNGMMGGVNDANATAMMESQIAKLEQRLTTEPDNLAVLITLGNLCFDAQRWPDAQSWYERALKQVPDNPLVITDLAVVYRNLEQPAKALELLDRSLEIDPKLWQAWFNKALILHVDLNRADEAAQAIQELRKLREQNPSIPDVAELERILKDRSSTDS